MRRVLAPVLVALFALAMTGCLSAREDADPQYLPVPSGEVREYYALPEGYERTPLFVGMTYGQALSAAEKIDFSVYVEDASEEDRNPHYDSWTVVAQDPAAGESTRRGATLKVLPNEEAGPVVTSALAYDPHLEEQRFTGVVTGYGENALDQRTVVVDDAVIQLDMVTPISEACDQRALGLESQVAKEQVIPLGAKVLVVMSNENDDRGFLHAWPAEIEPPAGSMNELLVHTGWWQPEDSRFDGGFDVSLGPEVASAPYTLSSSAKSEVELLYAPLIAAAGSMGIQLRTGGFGVCQSLAEADVASFVAYKEESDRRIREWEAEYQRRIDSGYYSCRDGDGDGICNER